MNICIHFIAFLFTSVGKNSIIIFRFIFSGKAFVCIIIGSEFFFPVHGNKAQCSENYIGFEECANK